MMRVVPRRADIVVRRETGGAGPQRFELTDALLPDGNYVAESLDRYLPCPPVGSLREGASPATRHARDR
ncbi:hypothetical protein SALBM135S_00032 [Streptomyces alboniger]